MRSHKILKTVHHLLVVLFLLVSLSPTLLLADTPVTKAPDTGITYECVQKGVNGGPDVYGNCGFDNLIAGTRDLVNFGIKITLSFSVVVIAFAGAKYMISGDMPGERKKANEMLTKVAKGIAFILAAWLIVNLITSALLKDTIQFGL